MSHILGTILPIFVIILVGWSLRHLDFMREGFLKPANRLVYFVAIPAMVFREIAEAEFAEHFRLSLVAATLSPLVLVAIAGLALGRLVRVQRRQVGTFLQSSFHGNLGYIGLAVAYYFLGNEGFTRASIMAGFLMLCQNFLSVAALSRFSRSSGTRSFSSVLFQQVMLNPIIIAATAGIVVSLAGIGLPLIFDRSLKILGGMALPLALLLIGASITLAQIRQQITLTLLSGACKLLLLPALGLTFFRLLNLDSMEYLPALILLASPTATVTYVMASEMGGDSDLATAAISVTTLASAVTFILWLQFGV